MSDPETRPPDPTPSGPEASAQAEAAAEALHPELAPFHRRVLDTLFNPGRVMEALAQNPAWAVALLAVAVLIALQTALIPWEVFASFQREAALAQGRTPPEIPERVQHIMQVATPAFAAVGATIFTFIFTGIFTLVFAFLLGDEGRYRQYLAVTCHATLIPALVGLALVPLKISQGNPQFTLNLSAFFFFLPENYLFKVLRMMDLSQIWSMLVIAVGVTRIDPRRSYTSAAVILLGFTLVIAMIFATFVPVV